MQSGLFLDIPERVKGVLGNGAFSTSRGMEVVNQD
jgi:hypothetical protein